jgi:hypothetical protein
VRGTVSETAPLSFEETTASYLRFDHLSRPIAERGRAVLVYGRSVITRGKSGSQRMKDAGAAQRGGRVTSCTGVGLSGEEPHVGG